MYDQVNASPPIKENHTMAITKNAVPARGNRFNFGKRDLARMKKLYVKEGLGLVAIGEEFGTTAGTIRTRLIDQDVQIRGRGGYNR